MNSGMLWFDNDPKTDLVSKLVRAVQYYRGKYGCEPDLCFMHPRMLPPDGAAHLAGLDVRPNRLVMPNHLWLGVHEIPQSTDHASDQHTPEQPDVGTKPARRKV
jgi:hypothetical protein